MNTPLGQIRKEFYRGLVAQGKVDKLPQEVFNSTVLEWLESFNKTYLPKKILEPKTVNSFCLGADPEFVFMNDDGRRVDAQNLGLVPGRFAGADQNGRLVEIRPHPNRSALHVVASLLDSMRWLVKMAPDTLKYSWVAGAYLVEDGIGGHVHFGRKRPTRPQEVFALDKLMANLMKLGTFPVLEQARRMRGDTRGQVYGAFGDYRLQTHGYEYRTFPSWLSSPWLALFVITLSKLIVHDPSLVKDWDVTGNIEGCIQNLLAFYKNKDDDARLCHWALKEYGFPKHIQGDFKPYWGLEFPALHTEDIGVYPASIKPENQTVEELFKLFATETKLIPREPKPNWSPLKLPEKFTPIALGANNRVQGMGDLVCDLVTLKEFPINILSSEQPDVFGITRPLSKFINRKGLVQAINKLGIASLVPRIEGNAGHAIYVGKNWRKNPEKLRLIKMIICSGFFPVWKISQVDAADPDAWKKEKTGVKEKKHKYYGKFYEEKRDK